MELKYASDPKIRAMKKIETHDHLDGAIRPETIQEIAFNEGIDLVDNLDRAQAYLGPEVAKMRDRVAAASTTEEFHEAIRFQVGMDLADCLGAFNVTTAVMQSAESLERIMYERMQDWNKDNVVAGEIRFCPYLHTHGGLDMGQVVDAVLKGRSRAIADGLVEDVQLIFSAIRNPVGPTPPIKMNMPLLDLAQQYRDRVKIRMDLAGGELGHPPETHKEYFLKAHQMGLPTTAHASETGDREQDIKNMWTLLKYGVGRVSHVTRLADDPELMREYAAHGIFVELNLTSNIFTGGIKNYSEHPLGKIHGKLKYTINTDDAWLCDRITLSHELEIAKNTFGLSYADLESAQQTARDAL